MILVFYQLMLRTALRDGVAFFVCFLLLTGSLEANTVSSKKMIVRIFSWGHALSSMVSHRGKQMLASYNLNYLESSHSPVKFRSSTALWQLLNTWAMQRYKSKGFQNLGWSNHPRRHFCLLCPSLIDIIIEICYELKKFCFAIHSK